MRYLPFLNGHYSVAPGLLPMSKASTEHDRLIFQFDGQYAHYRDNKRRCQKEQAAKYYGETEFRPETAETVNRFFVRQLLEEYPHFFRLETSGSVHALHNHLTGETIRWKNWLQTETGDYASLFDALCHQVQEDLAVCQLDANRDTISALHISAPAYWAPNEKLGKPFTALHAPVPGMEKTMPHHFTMLEAIVNKGPFSRFAWGLTSDTFLNHHPVPAPGADPFRWAGRIYENTSELFIRTERQTMTGFPACNAFLFTIRTYFYPVATLSIEEKTALMNAVEGMSPDALQYKGILGKVELIRNLVQLA